MTREEAIRIIESNCSCSGSPLREACAMFIPELRESEDERIRRTLVEYFRRYNPKDKWDDEFSFKDVLDYLEKQKEQKSLIKKGVKYFCIKAQKRRTNFYTYAFTVGTEYIAPENNVLVDNDGHSWDLTRQTPEWIFDTYCLIKKNGGIS